ncbi:MAG TPA: GGDEF domain-containing protein [Candidatus Paceibacterota bacterium]|jgi:diguanylate cyclase (GGDEF)-like protein|nr:GGDEF domain-containing protein [Candidatus Paceibacterota bacterium]
MTIEKLPKNKERKIEKGLEEGFLFHSVDPKTGKHIPCNEKNTTLAMLEYAREHSHITEERFFQLSAVLANRDARSLEKIAQDSSKDALTGVLRRDFLEPQLNDWIKELTEVKMDESNLAGFMFIILDVDNFKQFNEDYGHITGDAALSVLGARIKQSSKRKDDKLYRYGGDEFALMFPFHSSNVSDEILEVVFKRVQQEINDKLFIRIEDKNKQVPITVAMGYTVIRRGEKVKTIKEIIDAADKNQAKQKIADVKKKRMDKAQKALM